MRLSLRTPVLAISLMLATAFSASVAASGASAAGGGCPSAVVAPANLSKKDAERSILCLINKERASRGIGKVGSHGAPAKAARQHTRLMIRRNCFSHRCPGERELVSRMEQADYLPCNCYWGVGENLAYGEKSYGSPRNIVKAWMNSSEHRSNILNGDFEHVGIGIVWGTPENGFARSSATYTTDFGYRS